MNQGTFVSNISSMHSLLLLGIGNTLRSDDGAGAYVCAQLQQLQPGHVHIQILQQLQTELAEELLHYDAVMIIDASVTATEVVIEKMKPEGAAVASSHHMSVSLMQALAQQLYGKNINFYTCSLPAQNFEMGETLSSSTKVHADKAVQLLQQWITSFSN